MALYCFTRLTNCPVLARSYQRRGTPYNSRVYSSRIKSIPQGPDPTVVLLGMANCANCAGVNNIAAAHCAFTAVCVAAVTLVELLGIKFASAGVRKAARCLSTFNDAAALA